MCIRQESLRHVIPLGVRDLRGLVSEHVAHYNGERPHQGLDGRWIPPTVAAKERGPIKYYRERLGGPPKGYHREAA